MPSIRCRLALIALIATLAAWGCTPSPQDIVQRADEARHAELGAMALVSVDEPLPEQLRGPAMRVAIHADRVVVDDLARWRTAPAGAQADALGGEREGRAPGFMPATIGRPAETASDAKGALVMAPLLEHASALRRAFAERHADGSQTPAPGAVELWVEPGVSYAWLVRVVHTLGQAQADEYLFVVRTPSGLGHVRAAAPRFCASDALPKGDVGSPCTQHTIRLRAGSELVHEAAAASEGSCAALVSRAPRGARPALDAGKLGALADLLADDVRPTTPPEPTPPAPPHAPIPALPGERPDLQALGEAIERTSSDVPACARAMLGAAPGVTWRDLAETAARLHRHGLTELTLFIAD